MSYAPTLVRRRWLLLLGTLLAAGLLIGLGAGGLRFDVSNEALFVEGDPAVARFNELQEVFGSDEVLYLVADVQDPFQGQDREALLALGERLEELRIAAEPSEPEGGTIRIVDSIRSPLHSPVVFDEDEELKTRSFAKAAPRGAEEIALWRGRVMAYRPFQGLLINEAATAVGFLIRLDRLDMALPGRPELIPLRRQQVADAVAALLEEGPWARLQPVCVGTPVITTRIGRILGREMGRALLGGLAIALVLQVLLFRSLRPALAPFLLIVVSLLATLGLQGLLDVPLSQLSAILLTLVICVGIADAMHLIAAYERHAIALQGRGEPWDAGAVCALALEETATPCLLTSLTTAAGFLALLSSDLAPVRNLGLFSAAGCLFAYGALLTSAPALLTGWQPRPRPDGSLPSDGLGGLLARLEGPLRRRPGLFVGGALALACLAAPGASRLYVNNDPVGDLEPDEPLRRDLEFIHERMGGTVSAEVVIEPLEAPPEQLPPAELLVRAAALEDWLRSQAQVRSVVGVTSALLEICQAFDVPIEVPSEPAASAQLLTLLSSSDADFYGQHVAVDGSAIRISVRMNLIASVEYAGLLRELDRQLAERFAGVARAHVTGGAMLLERSNQYLLTTQRDSFLLALAVVSLLIALSTRELRLGLLSLVPNVLPVALVLGVMGWADIPVSVPIALIATIAIGIIVDDTIHFVHCLREELRPGVSLDEAIESTFQRAGRAILFTTLLLLGAFSVYAFAALKPLRYFGAIACLAFLAAFLADVVLLPALLRLWPQPALAAPERAQEAERAQDSERPQDPKRPQDPEGAEG